MVDINPKIFEKFKSVPNLPDDFQKLLKKLLEAQYALQKKSSTSGDVIASFNRILLEYVDNPEIEKYINDKTHGGANL